METIGRLFLLNAIGAGLLAVSLLITPTRLLPILATLGTLRGRHTGGPDREPYLGSLRAQEAFDANMVKPILTVDAAGCVLLMALALLSRR
ncbi:hypothetical protein ACFQ6S_06240 [Streptomyces sp. NPDC056479]|uniref:hypothetical protein n=1 Tax=Streptomyces sp. NPDC056479 TaxID=3345832 RepID=UPI0036C8452F